ncbi:hypothetical protein [Streptomyces sp. NPDC001292]|uniref:hypothetical protein n=1 Tax=Streptomyces sp. NPDC001292 TaxID=3364558 RepID=UPI0036C0B17A
MSSCTPARGSPVATDLIRKNSARAFAMVISLLTVAALVYLAYSRLFEVREERRERRRNLETCRTIASSVPEPDHPTH